MSGTSGARQSTKTQEIGSPEGKRTGGKGSLQSPPQRQVSLAGDARRRVREAARPGRPPATVAGVDHGPPTGRPHPPPRGGEQPANLAAATVKAYPPSSTATPPPSAAAAAATPADRRRTQAADRWVGVAPWVRAGLTTRRRRQRRRRRWRRPHGAAACRQALPAGAAWDRSRERKAAGVARLDSGSRPRRARSRARRLAWPHPSGGWRRRLGSVAEGTARPTGQAR